MRMLVFVQRVLQARELSQFDDITRIELWREGSTPDAAYADFYCEVVAINDRDTEKWFYFPVQRWLAPDSETRFVLLVVNIDCGGYQCDQSVTDSETRLTNSISRYTPTTCFNSDYSERE